MWKPAEIIVNKKVENDPATLHILERCPDVPVRRVESGRASHVTAASTRLAGANGLLDKIQTGKSILYVGPAQTAVDDFTMPDSRIACPSFARLKLASNGCFYHCDWCYLKLTYRAAFPYITVKNPVRPHHGPGAAPAGQVARAGYVQCRRACRFSGPGPYHRRGRRLCAFFRRP